MPPLPVGRLSGRALDALVTAVHKTPARGVIAGAIRARLGIDELLALPFALRGPLPFSHAPRRARASHERASLGLPPPAASGAPRGVLSVAAAFRDGSIEPEAVARRSLAAARSLANQVPTLGPLSGYDDEAALDAARESAERLRRGASLGPLDGVPIAIKEEIDVRGLPTRMGTGYPGHLPAVRDAVAVERLRRAGAVVIGQTAMTELGMSPLGANPHRRMPRNPHDPQRLAGGSSTGSAVAVALGVTPVSLGTDAGGSIRIPSAYCGVFGLKPSYGRIPNSGVGEPQSTSVVHLGPIGVGSFELAALLEACAGPDAADPASEVEPAPPRGAWTAALERGVRGVRLGVPRSEWAAASTDIARVGEQALAALEGEGAVLVDVHPVLFRWAAAIGYVTLGLEGLVGLARVRAEHLDELGPDLKLALLGLETFRPGDYIAAQRLRSALRAELAKLLADVDAIALPVTARGPLLVSEREARLGFLDPPALDDTCRFAFLANVTGLPAGTAPIGLDADALPVGLQIVGDAWDEACVLQVLAHLERIGVARVPKAPALVDLLA